MGGSSITSAATGSSSAIAAFCNDMEQLFTAEMAPEATSKLTEAIFTLLGDKKISAIMTALVSYTNNPRTYLGANKVPKTYAAPKFKWEKATWKQKNKVVEAWRELQLEKVAKGEWKVAT